MFNKQDEIQRIEDEIKERSHLHFKFRQEYSSISSPQAWQLQLLKARLQNLITLIGDPK